MTRHDQIIGFNNLVAGSNYSNHCISQSLFCKFHVSKSNQSYIISESEVCAGV